MVELRNIGCRKEGEIYSRDISFFFSESTGSYGVLRFLFVRLRRIYRGGWDGNSPLSYDIPYYTSEC